MTLTQSLLLAILAVLFNINSRMPPRPVREPAVAPEPEPEPEPDYDPEHPHSVPPPVAR